MKKIFIYLSFIFFTTSCLTPSGVQTRLNGGKYPLGYLHDSPIIENKTDITLCSHVNDLSENSPITSVLKKDGHSIWLLFYYSYDFDLKVNLGKNALHPELQTFVKQSFDKESERTGLFKTVVDSSKANYNLIIDILDYNVEADYYAYGNAMGNYQSWGAHASASKGSLKLVIKLVKKTEVLFEKEYTAERMSDFVQNKSATRNELNKALMKI